MRTDLLIVDVSIWMKYVLERYIVNNYVAKEVIKFCSKFLGDVNEIGISFNKNMLLIDEINVEKPLSGKWVDIIDRKMW